MHWLVGFIDSEGCFTVNITKGATKVGFVVQLNFNITQHIRDTMLFKFIQKCLVCGLIFERPKDSRVNLVISNFTDIVNILIPILNKYSLQGTKRFDLEDFIVVTKLMEKKTTFNYPRVRKN